MADLHVAWIVTTGNGDHLRPPAVIYKVISSETVTSSGSSAKSGERPNHATHALCTAIDGNFYVTGEGADNDASATFGAAVMTPSFHVFEVADGEKIAAITI